MYPPPSIKTFFGNEFKSKTWSEVIIFLELLKNLKILAFVPTHLYKFQKRIIVLLKKISSSFKNDA